MTSRTALAALVALIVALGSALVVLVVQLGRGAARGAQPCRASTVIQLGRMPATNLCWSPRGDLLAFEVSDWASERNRRCQVVVADIGSGQLVAHSPGNSGFNPTWLPDGTGVLFCHSERGQVGIWLLDMERGGAARAVVGTGHNWIPRPEGCWCGAKRLLFFRGTLSSTVGLARMDIGT